MSKRSTYLLSRNSA